MGVIISGLGHYVPERIVTNDELTKYMDTTDEWIQTRSGVKERRYVHPNQSTADLAFNAVQGALKDAKKEAKDLEFILFASLSPDHVFPGNSVFLLEKLGVQGIPAMDIRAQCSGFVYSLALGRGLIESGLYKCGLIVGAEIHSKGLDFSTAGRDVTVLFGDGAGVAIIEKDDSAKGIIDIELGADGRHAKDLWLEAPGMALPRWEMTEEMKEKRQIYPTMNGKKVFQYATTKMAELAVDMLKRHDLTESDIDLVICHQANIRIIEFVCKSLGWKPEKFAINIQKYGNTTAASIPIALSEAVLEGKIKSGSKVLMLAFGSGFTWGSTLVEF